MTASSEHPIDPPIFKLRNPRAKWGDYGDILVHGLAEWSNDPDKTLHVSRTGPFVPPVSMPAGMGIVVTAGLRTAIEGSGLTGARFLPVTKKKVVKLDWQAWDQGAREPAQYPPGGEPEGYVLSGRHDDAVCAAMPELLELRPLERVPFVECGTEVEFGREWPALLPSRAAWSGGDFFLGQRGYIVHATARAREWLEANCGTWVVCEPALWGP